MMSHVKIVPVGLAVVVLMASFIGFSNLSERRADAAEARLAAEAQEVALERKVDRLRIQLEEAQAGETETARLWKVVNETSPVGLAQQAITDVISSEGGMILALSDMQDTAIGNLKAVSMTVEAEADLAQWQGVMRSFSEHEPVMLVSSVELRRINRTLPGSQQPLVLFRLTVNIPFASGAS